jgi:hypothetical protein
MRDRQAAHQLVDQPVGKVADLTVLAGEPLPSSLRQLQTFFDDRRHLDRGIQTSWLVAGLERAPASQLFQQVVCAVDVFIESKSHRVPGLRR